MAFDSDDTEIIYCILDTQISSWFEQDSPRTHIGWKQAESWKLDYYYYLEHQWILMLVLGLILIELVGVGILVLECVHFEWDPTRARIDIDDIGGFVVERLVLKCYWYWNWNW